MDPMLGGIPITRTPLFVVTDSTGHVTHSGQKLQ